jgi:D-glycero-D-manno-heptose 1,7-bisphosphate phosphatase
VLLDRDGTIVVDIPYNGNPERVIPVPGAREALDRLREHNLPIGILTNQSGVGRGLITMSDVDAVNRRIEELLGPFAGWFICPHGPSDDCDCRKPKPKLVFDAAHAFGVDASCVVIVGDKESDVKAAHNAGAIPIKVDGTRSLADAIDEIIEMLD